VGASLTVVPFTLLALDGGGDEGPGRASTGRTGP